jgi:hypothetical protein
MTNDRLNEDIQGYESVYDMWLDQKVSHITPITKVRSKVKIKSLTPEEREKFLYLLKKLKQKYGEKSSPEDDTTGSVSSGRNVRVTDPLGHLKEKPRFIDVMYFSGKRKGFDMFEFKDGMLTVATVDSSLSLDIEAKYDDVVVANNVPVDAIKAYRKKDKWVKFPEMSQQKKFDLVNFAQTGIFLVDFFNYKQYVKFEDSSKDVDDELVSERNDLLDMSYVDNLANKIKFEWAIPGKNKVSASPGGL